ncbi:lytic transglycosylase domain-containing protein [Alicyclobacillus fastidiosus]|uniref:Lytic transglycosylase domain-containing protein n=1 Tax=Alicyclobacillus fastidiosus TaxID=392011 RepID=A0ABV5ACJ1_9BACL|nr:lytic transglycosylase domain-containing protein [Alicyclobacillus fastidiosus]WEH11327.1 lytic transglycosylase domain-containing protein [Alicyclobacillus fastidiosus]
MSVSPISGAVIANANSTSEVPVGNQIVSQWQSSNQLFQTILEETMELLANEEGALLPSSGGSGLTTEQGGVADSADGLSNASAGTYLDSLTGLLSLLPNFTTGAATDTSAGSLTEETGDTSATAASSTPPNIASLVDTAAAKYDLPSSLLSAVIQQESSFNPNAVSSTGAQGLMQLMPSTAAALGVTNAFDPAQNIDAGAGYLRQLLNQFGGSVPLALAAYNAGPAAVAKYQGVPPYQETQNYVQSILKNASL